jgi:hypothetical protein
LFLKLVLLFHVNHPPVSIIFDLSFAVQKLECPVSGTGYPFYGNGCSKVIKETFFALVANARVKNILRILIH